MTIALVLGGGAPNLTLMAGAVAALDDAGVEFDIVSTSGAGMLIGLLYAAPKGGRGDIQRDRAAALKNTVNMGVHDAIYRFFPVNFKVFHKPGTLAQAYTKFWQLAADNREAIAGPVGDFRDQWLKILSASPLFAPWAEAWKQFLGKLSSPDDKNGDAQRFFDDWAALMLATFCPSDLSATSQGMCQPAPFVEQVVDFSKLKEFKGEFYMSAYCIESSEMEIFEKKEINIEHFQAALAFPLIYAPFKMNGKTYLEGAAKDTLNFKGLLEHRKGHPKVIDTIVVLDVLGMEELIAEPRSLYDAWVKSIIVPLTAIAEDDIKLFERLHLTNIDNQKKYFGGKKPNLVKIDFRKQISHNNWPNVLDWSYSNLSSLYEAGYRAGSAAAETLKDLNKDKTK
ncbi:MAG TPA: patatin-like phospholipase family protein [Pseudolabrys sp.]|nr:patatin-like phospholipase family protein [Pseudolabrys sp.]